MRGFHRGPTTIVTTILLAALVLSGRADADGVIFIDSCQTLSIPNTVYKLTGDLSSDGSDCLNVAADRITIDLQDHSITGINTASDFFGIIDRVGHDLTVVKNGRVSGYFVAVELGVSTRSSVIGIEANGAFYGIKVGTGALVKSCVVHDNAAFGVYAVGDRVQVQQCHASRNGTAGILAVGPNCLVTMNSVINNNTLGQAGGGGIVTALPCTISFNTARQNNLVGILVEDPGSLVTKNTATDSAGVDFAIACPSTVTFNTSTHGFPASYSFFGTGTGCKTVGNE